MMCTGRRRPASALAAFAVAVGVVMAACQRDTQEVRGGAQGDVQLPTANPTVRKALDTTGLPDEGALARVAVGDLAGIGNNTLDAVVKNPYSGDMAAINEGRDLFVGMNCASCHGYDLKGGMGPDLTDTYWRYGGSPASIYKSIFEGRPQGMPAWGRSLPAPMIWKLAAYIEAQGGAFPARLADRGRQGDLANKDTGAASTMKGRNNVH